MVEGGTLLRCYTSQRGIEGSNPSSSASKALPLQDMVKSSGRDPGRHYTNGYTDAARMTLFVATNGTFVTVILYPRHQKW